MHEGCNRGTIILSKVGQAWSIYACACNTVK